MASEKPYDFLPLFLQEDVYLIEDHTSIDDPPEQEAVETQKPLEESIPALKIYGEQKNGVVIVTNISAPDLFRSPEYDLVLKMMTAVNLSMHEIALINLAEQQTLDPHQFLELDGQQVLCFGVDASTLGLYSEPKLYELTHWEGRTYLFAEDLSVIGGDVQKKRVMWKALQSIFL